MTDALPVVVAIVQDSQNILCIRRERGAYQEQWALPGGKIETDEHLDRAAVREVKEETGIETVFSEYHGVISERLLSDETENHFVLHVCSLEPLSTTIENGQEGEVKWRQIKKLPDSSDESFLVPSDHKIVEKKMAGSLDGAYRCVIDERDGIQELTTFTHI